MQRTPKTASREPPAAMPRVVCEGNSWFSTCFQPVADLTCPVIPRRLKSGQQQFVCLSFAFDRDGVPIDPDHARPAELIPDIQHVTIDHRCWPVLAVDDAPQLQIGKGRWRR